MMAADVIKRDAAAIVPGQKITSDPTDSVTVDRANVIRADVEADNGVIHCIDSALLPD